MTGMKEIKCVIRGDAYPEQLEEVINIQVACRFASELYG